MDENEAIGYLNHRAAVRTATIVGLLLALVVSVLWSTATGPTDISLGQVLAAIFSGDLITVIMGGNASNVINTIILELRLPRAILAALVGGSLAVAGCALQGIFRNPMASPYVLGVSSGAAFGASVVIVLGAAFLPINFAIAISAFAFSFITLFVVYGSSIVNGKVQVETLLLAGIAVGAFFSAMTSFMQYIAEEQLQSIVLWMMGGLWNANWSQVMVVIPFMVIGCTLMLLHSRPLNAMMIGEEHAMVLGVDVNRVRSRVVIGATLVTAAAVSFSGLIGFVGLIIPHMLRIVLGPDHRILLPTSILAGAVFLVVMDMLARTVMSPVELPVGILTAALGAPFFLYLLRRRRHAMGW